MPATADLLNALGVTLLLAGLYAGLPALAYTLCCGRAPSRQTIWLGCGMLLCLQALFGTSISLVIPGASPAWNLLLLLPFAFAASRLAARIPPEPTQADPWLLPLLLFACAVRLLSPLWHMALGQSDAYSHLQFLRDMLLTGRLRHAIYPPGHARIGAAPLWFAPFDLYVFARFAGAAFGTALVAGIHFTAEKCRSRTAARVAGLLAAGFPAFAPLLRTGVGLFANQFGLLLLPLILWSLAEILTTSDTPKRTLWILLLLFLSALGISVPMMLLDLVPILLILLLMHAPLKRTLLLLLLPVLLLSILLLRTDLPLETLQRTANMFTRQEVRNDQFSGILLQLLQDYFSLKTPPISMPQRLGIGTIALLAALAVPFATKTTPGQRPLLLLTALSGLQSATGLLQFTSYQRAGWFFLLSLCLVCGLLADHVLLKWPRMKAAFFLLIPVCLLALLFPPHPEPHLSPAEESLVRKLVTLRNQYQACATEPALHLWTRAFTRFDGGQGDPVTALIEDRPCITIHRMLPDSPIPPSPPPGRHLILTDAGDTSPTPDPVFHLERGRLLQVNARLLAWGATLAEHPQVIQTSTSSSDGLTALEIQLSEPDR